MCSAAAVVCFVACHGGPADHFATFAQDLTAKGYTIHICASGPALTVFQRRGVHVATQFDESKNESASALAKSCSTFSVVLTDIAAPFQSAFHKALREYAPKTRRLAYYDNPESEVPGGYSSNAAEVSRLAHAILFANARYEQEPVYNEGRKIDLSEKQRIGIGYYPVAAAHELVVHRKSRLQSPKTILYLGGNNREYFQEAFPAFLRILEQAAKVQDLSSYTFLLQQHPGAKKENLDGKALEEWKTKHRSICVEMSSGTTNEALATADIVAYYQTSMAPQLGLAGVPSIQVGHKPYPDLLVKNELCPTAISGEEFVNALQSVGKIDEKREEKILQAIGFKDTWAERLEKVLYENL